MERFIALKKERKSKVPPISEFISNLDGDPNAIFFKVANSLHETKNLNPIYAYTAYQDIIDMSPISPKNSNDKSDFSYFADLNPKDSYRWLYLIFSLASRQNSEDNELETAKIDYLYNAFYDFVINASEFKCSESQDKILFSKILKNEILFLSALFCTMARLIDYSHRVTNQIKSPLFLNKLLYFLNTDINKSIDQQLNEDPMKIQDFSVSELFMFCSPIPVNDIPLSDIFFDVNIYLKYSIFRFLLRLFGLFNIQEPTLVQSFKDSLILYYNHYILRNIARKVLTTLCGGDEKIASSTFNQKTLEKIGSIILDFSKSSDNFSEIIQKGEIELSAALSTASFIAKTSPQCLETFLQNNELVGKSIESLLCCHSNNFYFKVPAAKILAGGKWRLTNFKIPLLLLILSPSLKLKENIAKLLSFQGDGIVPDLLSVLPAVPHCGSKSSTFFKFLASLLPTLSSPESILSSLLDALRVETTNIYNMPNANLYSQILKYIKPQHSFFDPQVCQSCLNLEKTFSNKEIDFNSYDKNLILCKENQVYVKLNQPMMIKSFKFSYTIKSMTKAPRSILLMICTDEIKDIKDQDIQWKKVYNKETKNRFYFSCQQKISKINFNLPVYVTGFSLQFESFWKHGENTLFDYRCHNLKSESIICPECGNSTCINFKMTVKFGIAFPFTNINSCETCEKALQKSNELLEEAENDFHSIISLREKVEAILTRSMLINEKTSQLNDLYNDQCVSLYKQMTESLQRFCAIRVACGKYTNKPIEFNFTNYTLQGDLPIITDESQNKTSNEGNLKNDILSESVNHCYYCRFCFIRNCLNFFTDLQDENIKTKENEKDEENKENKDNSLLRLIHNTFDITPILLSYITNDSLFAQYAINAMLSFCRSIPELTPRINDIFVNSLPNVSSQLVHLICEIENINDNGRAYRLVSILPSLTAANSYLDSQSKFIILVLQPLVSTITNSPILIRNSNIYSEFVIYNAWRKLIHKTPSKMITPLSIVRNKEVLTSLLFNSQSETVRTSIKEILECSSKLSDDLYKQVYEYAFNLLTDSILNEFSLSSRQYFDFFLSLINNIKIRRHLLLTGFFDKFVSLMNSETEKILKQEDDSFMYYDNNSGFSIFILMRFIDLFVKPVINLRYVICRKESLVVNIITNYFKLRSIIFQRSKYLYDSLALMKDMILRIMQESFVLTCDESEEKESKKEKNNDENSVSIGGRGGSRGRRGRGRFEERGGPIRGRGGRRFPDDGAIFTRGGRGGRGRFPYDAPLYDDYDESPTNSDDHDMDSDTYNDNDNDNEFNEDNNNSNENNNDENGKNDEDKEIVVPNPNGPRIMIEAAVDAISFCPDIVIKEISAIIFPAKKVESIPIIFKKWRNQEDFLPGQLSRDPIMSDQIGKTFRDIRDKFAILLNLQQFMSEENFCELMVDNNIIAFDLPIASVYKRVWVPSRGDTPMEVYCRVTGLDGEATENMVNSLPSEEVEQQPPEEKYGFTTILCDCGGFSQLFNALDSYGRSENKQNHLSRESLSELVKLLETFSFVKRNRVEMNKLNGTNYILQLMKKLIGFTIKKGDVTLHRTSSANAVDMAMSLSAKAAKEAETVTTKEIFKQTIMIANSLITEDSLCVKNPDEWVSFILISLSTKFFRSNENLVSPFLSLLPPIAARSRELMEKVLVYFVNQLSEQQTENLDKNSKEFNIYENCKSLFMLNGFAEFVLVIPVNSLGNTIRDLILEEPFVTEAVSLLYKLFPPEEKEGRLSKKWQESVDAPYLPSMLKILVGMSRCHEKTQELLLEEDSKILKLLIELEAITSKANIGEITSDILIACETEPSVCKASIEAIRKKKKEEAKKKAQAEKQVAMNITQNISPELQRQLEELTEQSLECVICHEGYEFLPNELLGVYAYVNTSQGASTSSNVQTPPSSNSPLLQFLAPSSSCLQSLNTNFIISFNTATYFVVVHPSCHNRATASEDRRNHAVTFDANFSSNQSLNNLIMSIMLMDNGPSGDKAPHYGSLNAEWESASLRNSERPCNAIFPIPSSTLSPGAYKKALLNYIENFNGGFSSSSKQSPSFRSLADFRSIFIDLRTHIVLTAIGEKIPIQLGGGSFSSITALWPFLINAGHLIIDMNSEASIQQKQPTAREELEKELQSRIAPLLNGDKKNLKKDGIVDLFMLSIWLMSLEEWEAVRIDLLKVLLSLSLASDDKEISQNELFEKTKSILLFYIMIDRIQTMAKKPSDLQVKKDEDGRLIIGPHNLSSKWLKDFIDKINEEPASFQGEWSDFGEEIQDEIIDAPDVKTLLNYAQVPIDDFEAFLNECIKK